MEVADPGEQEFPIHKIDFHDNFNVGPYLNNDIAVIHISKGIHWQVKFSDSWRIFLWKFFMYMCIVYWMTAKIAATVS